MGFREWLEERRDDGFAYCEGKNPWVRGALGLYLLYAGVRHVGNPLYRSWFGGITLVFHEMGHIVFSAGGRTLMILGGSLMQLLVPAAAALYLYVRQRDLYGFAVGGTWLAFSSWDLATYVGDAAREELPLVSMGGTPEHDWSTLLTQWHCLNSCDAIATAIRVVAFVMWAASSGLGAWLVYTMWKNREPAFATLPVTPPSLHPPPPDRDDAPPEG